MPEIAKSRQQLANRTRCRSNGTANIRWAYFVLKQDGPHKHHDARLTENQGPGQPGGVREEPAQGATELVSQFKVLDCHPEFFDSLFENRFNGMSALSQSRPAPILGGTAPGRHEPGTSELPSSITQGRLLVECDDPMEAHPVRLTLDQVWQRCCDNPANSGAWEELLRRILPRLSQIVSRAVSRCGVHEKADVDDLLQDICLKFWLLTKSEGPLPTEEPALEAYFRAVAANTARDWIRRRFADKRDVGVTVAMDDPLRPLAEQFNAGQTREREVLIRELDSLLEGSERDRAVFWLYYRQGLTGAQIAAIPAVGLTVKGVESLIYRMTAALRKKVR